VTLEVLPHLEIVMRTLRTLLLVALTVGLLGATAYGAGYALREPQAASADRTGSDAPTHAPAVDPTTNGTRAPAPEATPESSPTGRPTTRPPVMEAGPALLVRGDRGLEVRDLQARLISIQWLFTPVSGVYDAATTEAVRGFQAKREIPVTGEVDRRTLQRLHAMTSQPTHEELHNLPPKLPRLDPRCTSGRALCVDKSSQSVRWVVDGEVLMTFEARFGGAGLETREGAFRVYRMSRDHVSSLYDTSMPFAMFFSGGQAVHYSPDFAAVGYNGSSHGCVNIRDYDGIAALFEQVRLGDKVIVYWS
jgi:hypothetical protein